MGRVHGDFFSGSSLSVSLIGDISKMSAQLQWMITRNTSSFSMKKRNVKQPFSTEPLHLTNRHCYKFSTLVHRNVIAVEPSKDKNVSSWSRRERTRLSSLANPSRGLT